MPITPLPLANIAELESRAVLKKSAEAHRYLAELKGVAASIPNEGILINTLSLQEAKNSSEIENIITTQDDLYRANLFEEAVNPATKEVQDALGAQGIALVGMAPEKTEPFFKTELAKHAALVKKAGAVKD